MAELRWYKCDKCGLHMVGDDKNLCRITGSIIEGESKDILEPYYRRPNLYDIVSVNKVGSIHSLTFCKSCLREILK